MKKIFYMGLVALLLMVALIVPLQAQGGVTVFSNLRITNFYRAQPRTALVLTSASSVDTTGTYQRISSAANVGISGNNLITEPAGTELILVNVGSFTITLTETAHLKGAGNLVLGPTDVGFLVSDGSDWWQITESNN